jgi:hypothetical protein
MKISEIITEASRAERERQKSAAREKALAQKREQEASEQERLRATAQKKLQRNLPHQIAPKRAEPVTKSMGFNSPEFEKYRVDDTVDSDFQGGYYLRFKTDMDGVDAYWSKGDLSYPQAAQFNQAQRFNRRFDPIVFQHLIDTLVSSSGRGGQPGYVNIELDRRYLNNPFYTRMYEYLLKHYPQGDYTMDASVNWELV